jgi:ankyrin repeat protein
MSEKDSNTELFRAIACSDQPGIPSQVQEIENVYHQGADLNGFSEDGQTPLTYAILGGMGSPRAVKKLLELGADPSQRDGNGWTPWSACISQIENPVLTDRMQKIKTLLLDYAADQFDEIVLRLQQAVQEQNLAEAEALLKSGVDPNAPIIDPLYVAIAQQDLAMVQLLLRYNANPLRHPQASMTYLVQAAETGNLALVQLLVNAGANLTQYGWNDQRYTAEFCARFSGHEVVANWLRSVTPAEILTKQQRRITVRNPKFQELYEKQTNGMNYDVDTEDIVRQLERWDTLYGIEISEVEDDGLVVTFNSLPADLSAFAQEIYEFCPDTIDQHFGCMDDIFRHSDPASLPPDLAEFLSGVDFEDERLGESLLQKSLQQSKTLTLWWD